MELVDFQRLEVEIKNSFIEDLSQIADANAIRGLHYYAYYAHQLVGVITTLTSDQLFKIFYSTKNHVTWKSEHKPVIDFLCVEASSSSEISIIRQIIAALFASVCRKKVCIFPGDYNFSDCFSGDILRKLQRSSNPFLKFFSHWGRELLMVSTPIRYGASKELLTFDWTGIESRFGDGLYKSWNKSCLDVFNAMVACGIENPNDITAESIGHYRISRRLTGKGEMAWSLVVIYIDEKFGTNKKVEIDNYIVNNTVASKPKVKSDSLFDENMYRAKILSEAQNLSCLLLDKSSILVLEPRKQSKDVVINNYRCSSATLENYDTSMLDKNSGWYLSQSDYLTHDNPEASTVKGRRNALKYLNTYLFDYLPFFFKKTDTVFEYPNTPEKFLGFVFVKPSLVLENYFFDSLDNKRYPLPIVDFIIKFSDLRKTNNTVGNNLARDVLAVCERYFRYMQTNLGAIDGFKIQSNPFESHKQTVGAKYSRSNKSKFDLHYWLYFRVFIKEVSPHILMKSAQQMLTYAKRMSLKSDVLILEAIVNDLIDFIPKSTISKPFDINSQFELADLTRPEAVGSVINVNREIVLGDKLNNLKILDVDLSHMTHKTCMLSTTHTGVIHAPYQNFLSILVSAYAGQRASNAAWLNADNFDADYNPSNDLSMHNLVDIRIYTDKVKPKGLDSLVPKDVMEMLRFAKRLRDLNKSSYYQEPMHYQDNPDSKKGKFKPLLQSSDKNSATPYSLRDYLVIFEKSLIDSGIDFDSKLFACPTNLSPSEFQYLKQNDNIPQSINYLIRNAPNEDFLAYVSIENKTNLTVHSLRKQLVSVFDVLLSDRDATQMLTGQTHSTIGYYTQNTFEEEAEIRSAKQLLLKNLATPKDMAISRKDILHTESLKEFIEKHHPITTHATSEIGSGINDINLSDEIAFSYTHICPYNNNCPQIIVRVVGRRNCHRCPKAISLRQHGPAIAATIRKGLDKINDLTSMLLKPDISSADVDNIQRDLSICYDEVSNWKIRHNLLETQDVLVIDKDSVVTHLKYNKPGTFKHNLWLRLQEADGCPSLQSERLQRIANRLTRKLYRLTPNLSQILDKFDDKIDDDPVAFAVSTLRMIADLNNTTVDELLNREFKLDDTTPLLELLDD